MVRVDAQSQCTKADLCTLLHFRISLARLKMSVYKLGFNSWESRLLLLLLQNAMGDTTRLSVWRLRFLLFYCSFSAGIMELNSKPRAKWNKGGGAPLSLISQKFNLPTQCVQTVSTLS